MLINRLTILKCSIKMDRTPLLNENYSSCMFSTEVLHAYSNIVDFKIFNLHSEANINNYFRLNLAVEKSFIKACHCGIVCRSAAPQLQGLILCSSHCLCEVLQVLYV